ncbi:MAG: tetratricopeptide repeat-containing glycosyltransferase family protein [Rhodoferax sp.]|nr:tetratricopeptide repeat-containing glycosyltransferase family protein [Rhodoferax sp.]
MFQQRSFGYTINKPPVAERLQTALGLQQQGKLVAARDLYQGILQDQPDNADALRFLGVIEEQRGSYEQAAQLLEQSARLNPRNPSTFLNLGNVRIRQRQFKEALQDYDVALSLKPDYAHAHLGRGVALERLNEFDKAMNAYELALLANKEFDAAQWNLACLLLLTGQYAEGWKFYESRWKVRAHQLQSRAFKQPLWLGEQPIAGKTLYVYDEQGLGDSIQFARYIPVLAARGARVILETAPSLTRLFGTLDGVEQIVQRGDQPPDFDFHCPLSSLPLATHTTLDTIPCFPAYLHCPPSLQTAWAERLKPKQGLRIGLTWSGNTDHYNDSNRSIPLQLLLEALPAGPQYVSLQKDVRKSDRAALASRPDITDLSPALNDFADTAALCSQLDLVISVDTSVAHLCGAMGIDTWVLVSKLPDWRWLLDRTDSPWYPSVRVIRQTREGEWGDALRTLYDQVEALCHTQASDPLRLSKT